ncbi:toxin [Bacillus sp. AFS054943]|uniref:Toxin n=1 Tax=Bacillus cereus TaxID=1396 RepID=A0A2C1LNJ0_BACCE|nr:MULTISPECIES: RICIN domain-containing protein [Bacillus]PGL85672.1 toxin [Bacillus sp. AFS054943]PGT99448.1 toxin [Bacillus cereus]
MWAPSSEAAAPEKNRYYSIHLKSNTKLAWDVSGNSIDNNRAILLWDTASRGDNEQFVFFPLDGQNYAIVNKNSGKPVTFGGSTPALITGGGLPNMEALQQRSWTGSPTEQWYLRDKGNNNYEIVNQGNQKVASFAYTWASQHVDYVDLDESNPSDSDRVFNIAKNGFGGIGVSIPGFDVDYGTFSLPNLPATGTRPTVPDYDGVSGPNQTLPQTSNSVVVGASLVPCIMVNDSQTSDYTKIHNSPYYTLVKEEYWDKAASTVLEPGATQSISFKTGMTSSDQQKMTETLSMKVGADFGLKFGDKTAALKAEISKTLQTETSTTNTELSEDTVTTNFKDEVGKRTGYTQYQLATKYTLKRADGSEVSGAWTVKNNKITEIRKSK